MTTWRHISLLALMLVMCSVLSARVCAEPQQVEMYIYHTHPPFMVDGQSGLSFDLAAFLTKASAGKYEFKVVPASRARVNYLLKQNMPIVVPWVNPLWFGDKEQNRYLWSSEVLMQDVNAVLSHRDVSLIYYEPKSLDGLIFAGVRGHVYGGIDDHIANGGNVRRVDADSLRQNIYKILAGYADVTVMPRSMGLYTMAHHEKAEELYISFIPHSIYNRRILFHRQPTALRDFIDQTLRREQDAWHDLLEKYR